MLIILNTFSIFRSSLTVCRHSVLTWRDFGDSLSLFDRVSDSLKFRVLIIVIQFESSWFMWIQLKSVISVKSRDCSQWLSTVTVSQWLLISHVIHVNSIEISDFSEIISRDHVTHESRDFEKLKLAPKKIFSIQKTKFSSESQTCAYLATFGYFLIFSTFFYYLHLNFSLNKCFFFSSSLLFFW